MIPEFTQARAQILANDEVAQSIYRMRLAAPEIAASCRPAQFVQVQTDPGLSPFLRRPFSVLRVDRQAGWFEMLYDVVGKGTRRMAEATPGQTLDIIGPLGLPFSPPDAGSVLLVAGGIGIVPLAFLAWDDVARRPRMTCLLGTASRQRTPDPADLLPSSVPVHQATDDGSLGHHGFVTDLIEEHVASADTVVFTCGPHPMMARVAGITADLGLRCFASLENHMACGFGACVGCVVECRRPEREDLRFKRVCVEGPVVDAHDIVW